MPNSSVSHLTAANRTRLAQLCKDRGLTRIDVIAATRISNTTLTRLFNNPDYRINRDHLAKLAHMLQVHPDEITRPPI